MRRTHTKFFLTAVKTIINIISVGCICLLLLALKTKQMADDVWKQLGISQSDANINIRVSIMSSNYLQYGGAKNAKNILVGNRAAVVNELVAYAKKYVASPEFRKEYEFMRSKSKPKEPFQFKINVDSIRAVEKHWVEESIKQTQANANSPNPKIKNAVPYRLEALKKELADLDQPDNKKVQAKVKELQDFNNSLANSYKADLEKYNDKFPENPQLIIKKRLQEILDITADVDFNAEVKQGTKFMFFVNPAYEKKPKEWKLAFRAGKQATDAVRAAAQKWLSEIK